MEKEQWNRQIRVKIKKHPSHEFLKLEQKLQHHLRWCSIYVEDIVNLYLSFICQVFLKHLLCVGGDAVVLKDME